MRKIEGIIFDMDGCLYSFDNGTAETFDQSLFSKAIHSNIIAFFQDRLGLSASEALATYNDFVLRHNGEVSLGLEHEHDIPREEYFATTWNIDPQEFISSHKELVATIRSIPVKRGVLSAAPKVWVDRVLDHLALKQLFEPAIFTGDPNIRKPDPAAFQQLADFWKVPAKSLVSIGDQEETDILPAKHLNMITVRIGNNIQQTAADYTAPTVVDAIKLLEAKKII